MSEREVRNDTDFEPFEDTLDTDPAETAGTPESVEGGAPSDQQQPEAGSQPQPQAAQGSQSAQADAGSGLSLEDQIAALRQERDEYYQKLLRATADYRNSQRRLEQDKQLAVQFANSSLIKELLPVIDNFERALSVDPTKTEVPTLLQGMQMVHDELLRVLKRHHVEEVAPKPGDPFDPELHHALMQQPSEQYEVPTVMQLLQKGYTHHGRTLRPAGVAVSRTE